MTFSAFVVDFLGMQQEAMPFYSDMYKWKNKANKAINYILEVGNFGHNKDYSYYNKYPGLVVKAISFLRHCKEWCRYFTIFPLDSIKISWRTTKVGVMAVLKKKNDYY